MRFISKLPDKRYVIYPTTIIEVGGRPVTKPGKSAQFSNGELVTTDKEVIAHLKDHTDFGVTLFVDEKKAAAKADPDEDPDKDPDK